MNLFVWDFHGVLEKDNEYAVKEVIDKVLKNFGYNKKISINDTKKLYGVRWGEYFRSCCPEDDDDMIKKMVSSAIELSLSEKPMLKYIKPQEGAFEVLKKIKQKGHINLVISNSCQKSLKVFIDAVNMGDLIDEYIGVDSHTDILSRSNGKIMLLKEYIKDKKFKKVVNIGDTEQDIDAGISIGASNYLFTNNTNIGNNNINTNADHVISDLRQILQEI